MGVTSQGFPYPSATDPVAQGADAVRLLADALDTATKAGVVVRLKAGQATLNYSAGLAYVVRQVLYKEPWPADEVQLYFACNAGGNGSSKMIVQARPWTNPLLGLYVYGYLGDGTSPAAGTAVSTFWVVISIRPNQGGTPQ